MLSKTATGRILSRPSKPAPAPAPPLNPKRVSQRLDVKAVHPLGQDAPRSAFSAMYARGGIPCRLVHGSVKHKVSWSTEPAFLDYNPLLVTFFEGLKETRHPYVFVVEQGLMELLDSPGSAEKVRPLLPAITPPLRLALSSKAPAPYKLALALIKKLAQLVGPALVPFLGLLLPPIAHHVLSSDIQIKELSYEALGDCEMHCGQGALKAIRSRVPTYSSVCFGG